MPNIREELAKVQQSRDGGPSFSGPYNGTGRDFDNLYSVVKDKDESTNGDRYAWIGRARQAEGARTDHLDKINQARDDETPSGRRNWNGVDRQEMNGWDKLAAGLGSIGSFMTIDAGNDFGSNAIAATVGSLMSPVTAFGSAAQNAYEAWTGRPVSEADEDLETMPDYDLDANEKTAAGINAVIDVAGLGFGGSKDYIQSIGRAGRYNALKQQGRLAEAAKVAMSAADAMPGDPVGCAKMIGKSMLEEGLEEAAQTGLEDIRYSQVDDGTLGRMAEAGAWGAVGGATMTGVSWGLNMLAGAGSAPKPDNVAAANSGNLTGDPTYQQYVTAAETRGLADADIQEEAEKQRDKGNAAPMSGSAKIVHGTNDLGLTDANIGIRTIRKSYQRNDASANEFVGMFNEAGRRAEGDQWVDLKRADVDDVFNTMSDVDLANWVNSYLDRDGFDADVYLKRDPHTKHAAVMKFRLKHVNAGNTIMVNTMVPQMFGGDIDGDTLGFLFDPEVLKVARYAPAYIMGQRTMPTETGERGRYGELGFDEKFMGFTLDKDLLDKTGVKLDKVRSAFDSTLGSLGNMTDKAGGTTSVAGSYYKRLLDAWNSAKGGDIERFAQELMNVRSDIVSRLDAMGAAAPVTTYANGKKTHIDDQADLMIGRLVLDLQAVTGPAMMFGSKMKQAGEAEATTIVNLLGSDEVRTTSGSGGKWKKSVSRYVALNNLRAMFEPGGNFGLRFKQNMAWKATTTKAIESTFDQLDGTRLDQAVQAMLHILAVDDTPLKQVQTIFRAFVANDFMNRWSGMPRLDEASFSSDRMLEIFAESYNTYVETYNKSILAEGITDEEVLVSPIKKSEVDKNGISVVRAFEETFENFAIEEFVGHKIEGVATLGDLLDAMTESGETVQSRNMMQDLPKESNDLIERLANSYGSRTYAKGATLEGLVDDLKLNETVTWDDNGNATYDIRHEPALRSYWAFIKQIIGIQECYAYGLINFESAINSRFARGLFTNDKSKVKNTVLQIKLGYGFRGYLINRSKMDVETRRLEEIDSRIDAQWAKMTDKQKASRGEDWVDKSKAAAKKNIEGRRDKFRLLALDYMRSYFGTSYLHDQIADLALNHSEDGSINDEFLMRMLDDRYSYEQKIEFFSDSQKNRPRFAARDNLIENASRSTGSELADGKLSNQITQARRASKNYERTTYRNALNLVHELESLRTTSKYGEQDLQKSIMHRIRVARQRIDSTLFAAQVWDAADVLKYAIDKGASSPNETILYQALAKRLNGGAKSALNRITGDTMNTASLKQLCQDKSRILSILADGSEKVLMDMGDGNGYVYVTRAKLFEASGVKLMDGSDPSFNEWLLFFKRNPNILTWLSDTTFDPVVGGDGGVVETMAESPVASISGWIDRFGDDRAKASRELDDIMVKIQNDPNNIRMIIGIISAKFPGTSFNDLIESPSRFRSEYQKALTELAEYEYYRLSGTSLPSSAEAIGKNVRDSLAKSKNSAVSRMMSRIIAQISAERVDTLSFGRMIEALMHDFSTSSQVEVSLDRLHDEGRIDDDQYNKAKKALEADFGKTISAIERKYTAVEQNTIDGLHRLLAVIRAIDPTVTVTIDDQKIMTSVYESLVDLLYSDEGGLDDKKRDDIETVVNEVALDVPRISDILSDDVTSVTDDPYSEYIISNGDIADELDSMARKIHLIQASGKFRMFSKVESVDEILAELKDLRDRKQIGELERIKDKYNSVIVDQVLSEMPGVGMNETGMVLFAYNNAETQMLKMESSLNNAKASGDIEISFSNKKKIPDMDFTNETAAVLSDFAISGLEGAGNKLMAGIEGGEYKDLIPLAGYDRNVDFGAGPALVRVGDVRKDKMLMEVAIRGAKYHPVVVQGQGQTPPPQAQTPPPISAFRNNMNETKNSFTRVGPDGKTEAVSFANLDDDDRVWIYRMDDTPMPDMNHMPVANVQTGKPFNWLTSMLLEMVYHNSEPGVFQRKKTIGKFDNIVRDMSKAPDLYDAQLDISSADMSNPQSAALAIKRAIMRRRMDIGKFYYSQFIQERMNKSFGVYDAYLLAQFTTPFVIVEVDDGAGGVRTVQVNVTDIWSGNLPIEDARSIRSVKLVPLSLSTVASKVRYEICRENSDFLSSGGSLGRLSKSKFSADLKKAIGDWSGYTDQGTDGINRLLASIPVLTSTMDMRGQATGRGAFPAAKFIDLSNGTNRSFSSSEDYGRSRQTGFTRDEAMQIADINKNISINNGGEWASRINDGKITYVSFGRRIIDGIIGNDSKTEMGELARSILNKTENIGKNIDGKIPFCLVYHDNDTAVNDAYETIVRHDGGRESYILVPSDLTGTIEALHPGVVVNGATVTVNGIEFAVINPAGDMRRNQYLGAVTPVDRIGYDDIRISIGVIGPLDDSPIMLNPKSPTPRAYAEDIVGIDSGQLFADINGAMSMPESKDDYVRFLEEYENFKAGKPSRFVLPRFPSGNTTLTEPVMRAAVDSYISRVSSDDLANNVGGMYFRTDDVNLGDCIGFVKMRSRDVESARGDYVYAPVILNRGNLPAHIDRVYCSIDPMNADVVQVMFQGRLTPKEMEGIKLVFPSVAFKSYARLATEEEWNGYHISLGHGIKINGTDRDIDELYPINTEESRLIDRQMTTLRENLFFGNMLLGGGLFTRRTSDGLEIDYDMASKCGWRPEEVNHLLNMGQLTSPWIEIARGERKFISDDNGLEMSESDVNSINTAMRLLAEQVMRMNSSPDVAGDSSLSPIQFLSSVQWTVDQNGEYKPKSYLVAPDIIDGVFGCINSPDMLLKLFSFVNRDLCPAGYGQDGDASLSTLLDGRGWIRVQRTDGDGGYYYAPGHIQATRSKHDSSELGIPSAKSSIGNQQITNTLIENGISDAKAMFAAMQNMMISSGYYSEYVLGGRYYKVEPPQISPLKKTKVERQIWGMTATDFDYDESIAEEGYRTYSSPLIIVDNQHDKNVVNMYDDPAIRSAVADLIGPGMLDMDVDVDGLPSELLIHNIVKCMTGYSFNDGEGSHQVTRDDFISALREFGRRAQQGKYPIQGGIIDNRYTLPLMPAPLMRYIYTHSRSIRNNTDWDGFVRLAVDEMRQSMDAIMSINTSRRGGAAKMRALQDIAEFLYRDNGMAHESPNIWFGYGEEHVLRANYAIYKALSDTTPGYKSTEEMRRDEIARRIKVIKELRDSDKYERTSAPGAPNGWVATWFGRHRTWYDYVFKNMVLASRTNAMLHPFLIPSSVLARAKGYGMARAMLFFRNGRKQDYAIRDQGALRSACKNQDARELWVTLNELSMNSDDVDAAINAGSYKAILEYARRERERGGRLKKISRGVFKTMTADGALTSQQLEVFLNEFSLAVREVGDGSRWNRVLDNGMTELERAVQTDLPNFLATVLSMRPDNPDFDIAQRARNVALQMDMAQRDAKSMVISEFFKRHSFCELMVVTHFMRFHQYVFNSNNWFLGHVAPSMAINWWFNDMLIRKSRSENPMLFGIDLRALNLESGQMHMNFQQACTYDVINMGISWVTALILAGLLDFEPPKDEEGNLDLNRIGNLNEWTILGMRVDVPWWLQDVLGPSLAMAAFAKSAWMGEPRLDILSNWFAQAMWNNPALRAADFVSALFTPAGEELDNMVEESELYADAKGGSPSMMQMWGTGALTYGLNWASQFITPSIVKEVYRTMPQYEHTYKRIYVRDENGNIVKDETGMPYTTLTTYEDQMKRRLSRQNPFLALLFNLTNDTGTGYLTWEMPTTTYYQNDELASVQYYSMYYTDENGVQQAKSADEINAMAFEIISVLQAEDDLEDLAASGWVLPYDTRVYVSKLLWDQVHYLDTLWSEWVENEAYDFEVLGDGDFGAGRQQYEAAKQAYNQDRQNLMDVYNKLWDESLSRGITKYNRYNTTYQQDASGNWYATGFRRGFIMNTAPGSTTDPGPTLGQYGNWETPAYRNPDVSAGGRALIPIDEAYLETPSISSWSEDGGGDGYSDMVALTVGALAGNEYEPNGTSGRPSYRYYYGGGGYGGGGGGGGGYRPKIYSNLPHVSMPYADSMYAERLYDPNYDYLRPNFETKGSREAYKRSDI